MIRIRKNGKIMTVARSAYNEVYKPNGWAIVDGVEEENVEKNIEEENVESENESEDELTDDDWADIEEEANDLEGVSKPLSEMNRNELEAEAEKLGIDISAAKSNKQLRELIRNNQ